MDEAEATEIPNPDAGTPPADLVVEYITLRDNKKAAEEKMDEWVKENFTNRMEALESELMRRLNDLGVDSLSAKDKGTVYKKLTTSVTVADASQFRRHVIGEEAWDLIDWRANKTAVNNLVENGEELPPGLNRSGYFSVGIRKK